MFDHRESLLHLLAQLSRQSSGRLREALAPLGLHPAQVTALSEIAAREGLTQAELALRLEVEQPGVARTLAGLESAGLLEKSSLGKGRAQGLYLSPAARALLPDAVAAIAAVNRDMLAELSRTEAAHLLDMLGQLAARRN